MSELSSSSTMSEHIIGNSLLILNEISRCRYGSVHLATNLHDHSVAAVKFVPTNMVASLEGDRIHSKQKRLPAEFVYGVMCKSPEVVSYRACLVDQGCWAMVMEFPEGYSVLRDHVITQGALSGEALVRMTTQLARALNTCVIKGVDHRNITPDTGNLFPQAT